MQPKSKVLIIAGSDSSGGAGIQADIKTVTALGSYAMTAITAVTAQNTKGVKKIISIPTEIVQKQITMILDDIGTHAVKIGMLHNTDIIKSVYKTLIKYKSKNVVLDPVMIAHINLSEQFGNHTIKRMYEALVWGSLKPQNGKINEKISRSVKNRQLMAVRKEKGKIAITNYKTLKVFQNLNLPKISLVECQLETGRTHQIRVHMNFKGNPILGDKSYGKTKKKFKKIDLSLEKKINNFNRQALHAKSLGFIHPKTKKEVFFEARRPNDFEALIKNLKKASV